MVRELNYRTDPGRIIDQADADLTDAGQAARQLGQILNATHHHTAHLGIKSSDERASAGRRPTGQESRPPVGTFMATSRQFRSRRWARPNVALTLGARPRRSPDGVGEHHVVRPKALSWHWPGGSTAPRCCAGTASPTSSTGGPTISGELVQPGHFAGRGLICKFTSKRSTCWPVM